MKLTPSFDSGYNYGGTDYSNYYDSGKSSGDANTDKKVND
jgi:hypothetical protein